MTLPKERLGKKTGHSPRPFAVTHQGEPQCVGVTGTDRKYTHRAETLAASAQEMLALPIVWCIVIRPQEIH